MRPNRRQFIAGAAAAALVSGCEEQDAPPKPDDEAPMNDPARPATTQPATQTAGKVAAAGRVSDYATDQVYDAFRDDGFFVIRRDGKLYALSSVCTHRGCKVRARPDASFVCRCHGSNFSPEGKVLNGPATRDLPRLSVASGDNGNLLVKLD
jgi:Rieske Fe-S protein